MQEERQLIESLKKEKTHQTTKTETSITSPEQSTESEGQSAEEAALPVEEQETAKVSIPNEDDSRLEMVSYTEEELNHLDYG